MKKLIILGLLLYSSVTFGQVDTIPVTFIYSDTSCKFNQDQVDDIFNSKCLHHMHGYVVKSDCSTKYLTLLKQPIDKRYKLWYYKKR